MAKIAVIFHPNYEKDVLPVITGWSSGINRGRHQVWTHGSISAGDNSRAATMAALTNAEIVVVLIDSHLLADDGFMSREWPQVRNKRHLILVHYRSCILPRFDGLTATKLFFDKALTARSNKNQAWIDIFRHVENLTEKINLEPAPGESLADQARANLDDHHDAQRREHERVASIEYEATLARRKQQIWSQIESKSIYGDRRFEVYQLTEADIAPHIRGEVRSGAMEHLQRHYDIGREPIRRLLNNEPSRRMALDLLEWLVGPECELRVDLHFHLNTQGLPFLQGFLIAVLPSP